MTYRIKWLIIALLALNYNTSKIFAQDNSILVNVIDFDMKSKKNVAAELPHAKDGSSGAIFSQCKVPNFILDFKTASANLIVSDFLNHKIYSSAYGADFNKGQAPSYIQHKLIESYDAVIFIRETNPATDMKTAN